MPVSSVSRRACNQLAYHFSVQHTFFVTDHRQSFADADLSPLGSHPPNVWLAEELRRTQMRREIFPDLADTTFIFANFSQVRCQ